MPYNADMYGIWPPTAVLSFPERGNTANHLGQVAQQAPVPEEGAVGLHSADLCWTMSG